MSLFRRKPRNEILLDLTPCSDVIFTLLIFYILTQSFVTTISIGLPALSETPQTVSSDFQKIEVHASGRIVFNDAATDLQRLGTTLSAASTGQASDSLFLIFADESSPAGISLKILDLLRKNGITRVSFAGKPESEWNDRN